MSNEEMVNEFVALTGATPEVVRADGAFPVSYAPFSILIHPRQPSTLRQQGGSSWPHAIPTSWSKMKPHREALGHSHRERKSTQARAHWMVNQHLKRLATPQRPRQRPKRRASPRLVQLVQGVRTSMMTRATNTTTTTMTQMIAETCLPEAKSPALPSRILNNKKEVAGRRSSATSRPKPKRKFFFQHRMSKHVRV